MEWLYDCDEKVRIDKFLSLQLPEESRSFLQKLIKEEACRVNGRPVKPNYLCCRGDQIDLLLPEKEVPQAAAAEDIALDIVFEDDDFLVVNKPRGMVVHPAPGHTAGTLVNAVIHHCQGKLSGINGDFRPGIVHRIDKDTTGLLLIAKNDEMHEKIAAQLKNHQLFRRYEAIVQNNVKEDEGTISTFLNRAASDRKKRVVAAVGKWAVTHYQVLERLKQGQFTYISCRLETGRTHQIRVHMAHLGNPVLGDKLYGPKKSLFHLKGQLLHARELGFIHPRTGREMRFSSDLPEDFKNILTVLRNYDNLFH